MHHSLIWKPMETQWMKAHWLLPHLRQVFLSCSQFCCKHSFWQCFPGSASDTMFATLVLCLSEQLLDYQTIFTHCSQTAPGSHTHTWWQRGARLQFNSTVTLPKFCSSQFTTVAEHWLATRLGASNPPNVSSELIKMRIECVTHNNNKKKVKYQLSGPVQFIKLLGLRGPLLDS